MKLVSRSSVIKLLGRLFFAGSLFALIAGLSSASNAHNIEQRLDTGWRSIVLDADSEADEMPAVKPGFERADFDDQHWKLTDVPHNWQGYSYARQVRNGSRHGVALYRKVVNLKGPADDERIFIKFEGVGTYATVWLNGAQVGQHGGALTSFELDITDAVKPGKNVLVVRADNPDGIVDLPWAPGDDQPKWGYSEGSQPFGIFRPVSIISRSDLHMQPFGIYAWGGLDDIGEDKAALTARAEIANDSSQARSFTVVMEILSADGKAVAVSRSAHSLEAGERAVYDRQLSTIKNPELWSPENPFLYTLRSTIVENGKAVDQLAVPYGIRTYEIRIDEAGHRRFYVNGKQYHIQGTAEYEHLLGNSHAFSDVQIDSRVDQIKASGFNTFRDAHYPHNLRYSDRFAQDGMFWWAQFSAHNWHDNSDYRENFKSLLADWVRERRNNPALFFWGLQNESELPAEFAKEAVALIKELDPTTSTQRLVVACNGGDGTDWNVPQNWSGTYGGNPDNFAEELKLQGLVGEYGAWRSLGWHTDAPYKDGEFTESHAAALLQKKARLADSVSESTMGHLQWIFSTHENPGRSMRADGTQIWDGIRPLEHVGPANNKGLLTLWGEPTDLYYMYRARQVPASVAPVVYIVSHSWPDRWVSPGTQSGIEVYSNCDAVELYNDVGGKRSLGPRDRNEEERFIWNNVDIRFNVLSAHCMMDGDIAATDRVVLNNLPDAPDFTQLIGSDIPPSADLQKPYLYTVNVGGQGFVDSNGVTWAADRQYTEDHAWGWSSWAEQYPNLDPALGSRGVTYDPVKETNAQQLLQTFRYGRDQLRYRFSVPNGQYIVSLYFVEPWYGRTNIDATSWRVFDVAINDRVVLKDFDIFAEAGFSKAVQKDITVQATSGMLEVSFPFVAAGQAIISGIAIAADQDGLSRPSTKNVEKHSDMASVLDGNAILQPYLDNANPVFVVGKLHWTRLPLSYLDQDYLLPLTEDDEEETRVELHEDAVLAIAIKKGTSSPPGWTQTDKRALATEVDISEPRVVAFTFFERRVTARETVVLPAALPVVIRRELSSPYTPGDFVLGGDLENLFEAEDSRFSNARVATTTQGYSGQGYLALGDGQSSVHWPVSTGIADEQVFSLRYHLPEGIERTASVNVVDKDQIVIARMKVSLKGRQGWHRTDIETPTKINAGDYQVVVTFGDGSSVLIDSLSLK